MEDDDLMVDDKFFVSVIDSLTPVPFAFLLSVGEYAKSGVGGTAEENHCFDLDADF